MSHFRVSFVFLILSVRVKKMTLPKMGSLMSKDNERKCFIDFNCIFYLISITFCCLSASPVLRYKRYNKRTQSKQRSFTCSLCFAWPLFYSLFVVDFAFRFLHFGQSLKRFIDVLKHLNWFLLQIFQKITYKQENETLRKKNTTRPFHMCVWEKKAIEKNETTNERKKKNQQQAYY